MGRRPSPPAAHGAADRASPGGDGDDEALTPEERDRHPFYAFMDAWDTSHACLAVLDKFDGLTLAACAMRHKRAGYADQADKAAFGALLPHLAAAAQLQLRLEDEGARLAVGMMGAVGQAALVCDGTGRVAAATSAAEAALAEGLFVMVREGRLGCPEPASDRALAAAVAQAGGRATLERPAAGRIRLHDAARRRWVAADVAPLPAESAPFRLRAAVMVLLQLGRPAEDWAKRLIRLYRLTAAEAEVALALAAGDTVAAIAERRGVAVSTLRTQLGALLAKTGAGRQAELVALVLRAVG